ncbi:DNA circularization protein [Ralstonia pseudosolanacearum]|uniref:DNA circularization protein n=1 Tax=Ralstonia pseudosolanacearum TaxID=1310165 RepID=UPI0008DA56FE|nr:DNA circularization N-terminal domain-containing protein [Ralstonia pseudosolanacearum]MCL1618331.1 DNA circularization N-terminal domain-containing protein [Ralstonia pseudosolanacearum CaRs-Mep]
MAWKDNLLPASFRGVAFEVIETEDVLQRAVVEHEYAYVDGADTEDLGEKARPLSIQAIFWGDDYEFRLRDFIKVLQEPGDGELVHPVFGTRQVQLISSRIRHTAEMPDAATLVLEFKESRVGQPFFNATITAAKTDAVTDSADNSWLSAINNFNLRLPTLRSVLPGVADALALANAFSSKLMQVRNIVSGYISSGLSVLDYPTAWMGDVRGLFQAIVDPFRNNALTRLTSVFGGSTTTTASGATVPVSSSSAARTSAPSALSYTAAPARMTAWTSAVAATSTAVTAAGTVPQIPTTMRLAAQAALTDATAVANAQIRLGSALALAEMAAAVFSAEIDDTPTLNPDEIDQIAADARTAIQGAIDDARAIYDVEHARYLTEPLKQIAFDLQEAARAVLMLRPPLMVRTAPVTGNLALVAFVLYGDYTRWYELARLNPQIRMPNFIRAGQAINAYAT